MGNKAGLTGPLALPHLRGDITHIHFHRSQRHVRHAQRAPTQAKIFTRVGWCQKFKIILKLIDCQFWA